MIFESTKTSAQIAKEAVELYNPEEYGDTGEPRLMFSVKQEEWVLLSEAQSKLKEQKAMFEDTSQDFELGKLARRSENREERVKLADKLKATFEVADNALEALQMTRKVAVEVEAELRK